MKLFTTVKINGLEYPVQPGEVPPAFLDKWVDVFAIAVDLKNEQEFKELVRSISEHTPTVIVYPRGDTPSVKYLSHRVNVERVGIVKKGINLIRANIVYRLWSGEVKESQR